MQYEPKHAAVTLAWLDALSAQLVILKMQVQQTAPLAEVIRLFPQDGLSDPESQCLTGTE